MRTARPAPSGKRKGTTLIRTPRPLPHALLRPLLAVACWAGALTASPAAGDVESSSPAASILIPHDTLPACLTTGDFTLFAWVRTPQDRPAVGGLVQMPVLLELSIPVEGTVRARLTRKTGTLVRAPGFPTFGNSGELPVLTAEMPFGLPRGEWALLAVSYRRAEGRVAVLARSQTAGTAEATSSSPAFAGFNPGPAQAAFSLGANPNGLPGFVGVYGPVAVRDHAIGRADFEEVFASRRFLGVFDHDNTARGGRMNGPAGCKWMANQAMTTLPHDRGAGGLQSERAAVVGTPVTPRNFHVFDAFRAPGQEPVNSFRAVYGLAAASGFTYRSHRDPPLDGFFVPDLAGSPQPLTVVWNYAPRTRQLVTGPDRPLRVVISSNSRAVKRFDGSGLSPGNYAHGFIDLHRGRVCGILFRPVENQTQNGHPWFGFDTKDQAPAQSPSGVQPLEGDLSAWGDFTRFFTGSGGTGRGPGAALRLAPGAFLAMRCRPEPGSLLEAGSPLVVEAYVLRFPGASAVLWRPDRAPSQGAEGVLGPVESIGLDTTTLSRPFGAGDAVVDPRTLRLSGDLRAHAVPDAACFIASGEGAGAIGAVERAEFDGAATTVVFEHPLGGSPSPGSVLRFGAWGYSVVRHRWDGVAPGDPNTWRGLRLAAGGAGAGVIVHAYSAWRPGVNGYIFGTAGWGGAGYQRQLDEGVRGSIARWAALTGADVWLQVPAQQDSTPPSMLGFTERVRAGLPSVELCWAVELSHGGLDGVWGRYVAQNARGAGVVGVVSTEHPRLGHHLEQLADGMRSDGAHLSQRGNLIQAQVWTEMLAAAAMDDCSIADFDRNGTRDVFDFLAFTNAWGLHDDAADIDRNEAWDVLDFLAFQNHVAACP